MSNEKERKLIELFESEVSGTSAGHKFRQSIEMNEELAEVKRHPCAFRVAPIVSVQCERLFRS